MPNCKPGDLAIIYGLTNHPEDNGMIVTTVEIARINTRGYWWTVQPARFTSAGDPWLYNDRNLKPIRGTGTPQAVTHHTSDKQTA